MVKFLKRKFFLYSFAFGFIFSFLIGFFAKNEIPILLIKSIVTGMLIGCFGLGLDFFLIKTLGEEEYERIFSFQVNKSSEPKEKPKFELREEVSEEEKKQFEEIIGQKEKEEKNISFNFSLQNSNENQEIIEEKKEKIEYYIKKIQSLLIYRLNFYKEKWHSISKRYIWKEPQNLFLDYYQYLDQLEDRLKRNFINLLFLSTRIFLALICLLVNSNPITIIISPTLIKRAAGPFMQIIPEFLSPGIT